MMDTIKCDGDWIWPDYMDAVAKICEIDDLYEAANRFMVKLHNGTTWRVSPHVAMRIHEDMKKKNSQNKPLTHPHKYFPDYECVLASTPKQQPKQIKQTSYQHLLEQIYAIQQYPHQTLNPWQQKILSKSEAGVVVDISHEPPPEPKEEPALHISFAILPRKFNFDEN